MDRVERLLRRVKPKQSIHDKLQQDNQTELTLPETGIIEKVKFNYALLDAFIRRRKEQRGEIDGKD